MFVRRILVRTAQEIVRIVLRLAVYGLGVREVRVLWSAIEDRDARIRKARGATRSPWWWKP